MKLVNVFRQWSRPINTLAYAVNSVEMDWLVVWCSYMQTGRTLEWGSRSRWNEKCFHASGRFPVHPMAFTRRRFRCALFSRSQFVPARKFTLSLCSASSCPGRNNPKPQDWKLAPNTVEPNRFTDYLYHGPFVPSLDFSYLVYRCTIRTVESSYPPGLFVNQSNHHHHHHHHHHPHQHHPHPHHRRPHHHHHFINNKLTNATMCTIAEIHRTRLNAFARSCLYNTTAVAAQCYSQQTNSDSLARRHHQVRNV